MTAQCRFGHAARLAAFGAWLGLASSPAVWALGTAGWDWLNQIFRRDSHGKMSRARRAKFHTTTHTRTNGLPLTFLAGALVDADFCLRLRRQACLRGQPAGSAVLQRREDVRREAAPWHAIFCFVQDAQHGPLQHG